GASRLCPGARGARPGARPLSRDQKRARPGVQDTRPGDLAPAQCPDRRRRRAAAPGRAGLSQGAGLSQIGEGIIAPPRLHNRVLLVLAIVALAAGAGLAFLSEAPNRLISGRPIALGAAVGGAHMIALLPPRRFAHYLVAAAAAVFLVALPWLAGAAAAALAEGAPRAARISLGGG